VLATLLESSRRRADALAGRLDDLRRRAAALPPARGFARALTAGRPAVIAEVKRRSPSRGDLAPRLDVVARVEGYVRGGAAAVSVLTEPHHFSGSNDDLVAVRRAVPVPVLRKDFTVAPVQVWEARAIGADAVLLIVAALDGEALGALLAEAAAAGLDALVEVHTEAEVERALAAGATLVGVNNRDLATFEVDLATAERLAPLLGSVPVRVAESGIAVPEDAARMAAAGYHAVLVGESLVRSDDPAGLVARLRGAA
jgi:indole-3-glycerol phosphate synthase